MILSFFSTNHLKVVLYLQFITLKTKISLEKDSRALCLPKMCQKQLCTMNIICLINKIVNNLLVHNFEKKIFLDTIEK